MADRFDKFTENARRVLTNAQMESMRLSHSYIGTEHLLLGLLRLEECMAMRALSDLGVETVKVRSAMEFIIGQGDRPVLGEIGLTFRAKKVIELAVDEARRLNHHYIGTEHLLLGLVREGEGIAAGVLESLGVNLERARAAVTRVLQAGPPPQPEERGRIRFQPAIGGSGGSQFQAGLAIGVALTEEAREALRQAIEEARQLGAAEVRPEHLLLALTYEGSGLTGALAAAGVDVKQLRSAFLPGSPEIAALMRGLDALRKEKDSAIAAQEYERAARLRDQELMLMQKIRELEEASGSDG